MESLSLVATFLTMEKKVTDRLRGATGPQRLASVMGAEPRIFHVPLVQGRKCGRQLEVAVTPHVLM